MSNIGLRKIALSMTLSCAAVAASLLLAPPAAAQCSPPCEDLCRDAAWEEHVECIEDQAACLEWNASCIASESPCCNLYGGVFLCNQDQFCGVCPDVWAAIQSCIASCEEVFGSEARSDLPSQGVGVLSTGYKVDK